MRKEDHTNKDFKKLVQAETKIKYNRLADSVGIWVELRVGRRISDWLQNDDIKFVLLGNEKVVYVFSKATLINLAMSPGTIRKTAENTNSYGFRLTPEEAGRAEGKLINKDCPSEAKNVIGKLLRHEL
jgi:hypothetical protein